VLNLGKFHRPRAFFVVIRHVIDPNVDWIAAHQSGILSRTVEVTELEDVVRMEQVSTILPLESCHGSHSPANANGFPSLASKQ